MLILSPTFSWYPSQDLLILLDEWKYFRTTMDNELIHHESPAFVTLGLWLLNAIAISLLTISTSVLTLTGQITRLYISSNALFTVLSWTSLFPPVNINF